MPVINNPFLFLPEYQFFYGTTGIEPWTPREQTDFEDCLTKFPNKDLNIHDNWDP